jgi:Zn-dependent protease
MKLLSFPLLFLAPAYVAISGALPMENAIIAFAGPAVNLLLFGVSWFVLKYKVKMSINERAIWIISKRLNLLLFAFNLIPIPPLDGYQVLDGIMSSL